MKEKFEQAIGQGSDTEMLIHEFCDKLQIPFEKISSEDFGVPANTEPVQAAQKSQ